MGDLEGGGVGTIVGVQVAVVGKGVGGSVGSLVGYGVSVVGANVGVAVGAAPLQNPPMHTSLTVAESRSSHVVPSVTVAHMPVAESQEREPPFRHMAVPVSEEFPMAGHPTVKQSPTWMSSRAKSPVKELPEVYLVP